MSTPNVADLDLIPPGLLKAVRSGDCVLFVGAGLSIAAGLPSWPELLKDMLSHCLDNRIDLLGRKKELERGIKQGELIATAQSLRELMGERAFLAFLKDRFYRPDVRPTENHLLLPTIPFAGVLTTNYDKLVEAAYTVKSAGQDPPKYTQKDVSALGTVLREKHFFVLKAHGDIDRPDTIVLGSRDFRNALFGNEAFDHFFGALWLTKTILFVGFGLADPDLNFRFDKLNTAFKEFGGQHYALLSYSPSAQLKFRELEANYHIHPIPYRGGHGQVTSFFRTLAQLVAQTKRAEEPPPVPLRQFVGVEHTVTVVAYNATGTILASGERSGRETATGRVSSLIRLWDVATGVETRRLAGHVNGITGLAFSPDGNVLASGGNSAGPGAGTLKLWDVATGQEIRSMEGMTGPIRCLAFHPSGQTVVAGHIKGGLRVWDVATGKLLHQVGRQVSSLAFNSEGTLLASTQIDGSFVVMDGAKWRLTKTITDSGWKTTSLAFSPDGRTLAGGCSDGAVRLWDTQSWEPVNVLSGSGETALAVAFDPSNKLLAAASGITVAIWDVRKQKRRRDYRGHKVACLAWSPNGETLTSGGCFPHLLLWDARLESDPEVITKPVWAKAAHDGVVLSVTFNRGSDLAVSIGGHVSEGEEFAIKLWKSTTGKEVRSLSGHAGPVKTIACSPTADVIVSGGANRDGTIRVWDASSGIQLHQIPATAANGYIHQILSVAFSGDGKLFATGGENRMVRVWDTQSYKEKPTLGPHASGVMSISVSPDGRLLLATEWDGRQHRSDILVWELETGCLIRRLCGHVHYAWAVSFFPDGRRAISGSFDGSVRIWDVTTGKEMTRLLEGGGIIRSVAVSPDGRFVSSGGDNGVHVWDLEIGEEIRRLCPAHNSGIVFSVAFSPSGRYLVTGGFNPGLHLWKADWLPHRKK
jgi:WD40 repeat protein